MAAIIFVAAGGLACRGFKPKRDAAADARSVAVPELGPPVDLVGTVQDSRGTPLPDALVIAWPKNKHSGSVVQARSNPDGRFVLPRLLPGTWTLLAEAAGFGTLELDRVVPDSESVVLALEGEGRSLSGLVLSSPTRAEASKKTRDTWHRCGCCWARAPSCRAACATTWAETFRGPQWMC